jgi:hypothetical protein
VRPTVRAAIGFRDQLAATATCRRESKR